MVGAPEAPIVNEITTLNSGSLWKLPKVVSPSSRRTVLLVKKSSCRKLRNESTGCATASNWSVAKPAPLGMNRFAATVLHFR